MATGTGSGWFDELASAFEFLLLPFACSSVKADTLSDEGGRTEDGLCADTLESEGELDSVAETCAAACSAAFFRAAFIFLTSLFTLSRVICRTSREGPALASRSFKNPFLSLPPLFSMFWTTCSASERMEASRIVFVAPSK